MSKSLEALAKLEAEFSENSQAIVGKIRLQLITDEFHNAWRVLCIGIIPALEIADIDEERIRAVALLENEVRRKIATVFLQNTGYEHKKMTVDELTWVQRINWCKTSNDYLKLFEILGITPDQWSNSTWMLKNFGGLYERIKEVSGFKKWSEFRVFMGFEDLQDGKTWSELVKECKDPTDFLKLFESVGIKNNEWDSSEWLQSNGFFRLQWAIVYDPRFSTWKNFRSFMNLVERKTWNRQVDNCKTPADFLSFFVKLNLNEFWRISRKIRKKCPGLELAIRKKFGSWSCFLSCMDGQIPMSGIESTEQAKLLLDQEIMRLRSTGKWIEQASNSPITREEYDEISREVYYSKNGVVRAVADHLREAAKKAK
ncbi:MAG: hypothetical protein KBD00_00330 [Candidatus Peribacteraceae bacterium]|nr:hypothetical protein [Candidatus Peribacteraceae bacterium]